MQVLKKYSKRELVQIVHKLGVLNDHMISVYRNDRNPRRACDMEEIYAIGESLASDVINAFPQKYGEFKEKLWPLPNKK